MSVCSWHERPAELTWTRLKQRSGCGRSIGAGIGKVPVQTLEPRMAKTSNPDPFTVAPVAAPASGLHRMPINAGVAMAAAVIRDALREDGELDPDGVRKLAGANGLPEAAVRGWVSYYAELAAPPAARVCQGTSCLLAGGDRVRRRLEAAGETCRGVYCLGYCDRSPAWMDREEGVHLGEEPALTGDGGSMPDTRCLAARDVVTGRLRQGGAATLERALELGVYRQLEGTLQQSPSALLDAMERSGNRGRGGAAFLTAGKWRDCAATPDGTRYVIANGDEGDPGSFIDRVLMEHDPHSIIEGMILCGRAVGAVEGIVYIRSEYPRAIEVMRRAIGEARAAGILGRARVAGGFGFDVEVFAGMGSYVCGEETALIASIEGRRGEVMIRPPYPTRRGLHGCPTVVNNVETLVNVPFILHGGAAAYAAMGTGQTSGTKVVCFNHGFARPGMVEVEFGMSLRTLIEEVAGGGAGGCPLAAVIVGGPMGSLVPADQWDQPVCYDALERAGIHLGHAGVVAVPEDADFKALLRHWMQFMIDESCGKCVPCRLGSQGAANVFDAGGGRDLVERGLEPIFEVMEQGSLCAFGQYMPGPMRGLLEHFGDRIFAGGDQR